MRLCTLIGHLWSDWKDFNGGPKKLDDGNCYSQLGQTRRCDRCNYRVTRWLQSYKAMDSGEAVLAAKEKP